jgi:hypothetical protein
VHGFVEIFKVGAGTNQYETWRWSSPYTDQTVQCLLSDAMIPTFEIFPWYCVI